MIFAVEPGADLCSRHRQVELELATPVYTVLALAFDDEPEVRLDMFWRVEDGDVDRVGPLRVRWPLPDVELRPGADVPNRIAEVVNEAPSEDLDGLGFFGSRANREAADEVSDVPLGQRAGFPFDDDRRLNGGHVALPVLGRSRGQYRPGATRPFLARQPPEVVIRSA